MFKSTHRIANLTLNVSQEINNYSIYIHILLTAQAHRIKKALII